MNTDHTILRPEGQTTESQREIWTACQLGLEASLAYNESVTLTLDGAIDAEAMSKALGDVQNWHEALRLVVTNDGQNFRVAPPLQDYRCQVIAADHRPDVLSAYEQAVVKEPFDLATGPLFRALILSGKQRSHVIITAHHMVCDGWSIAIVLRDLGTLYKARTEGRMAQLPPAQSFTAFAARDLAYQESAAAKDDLAYWQSQFATHIPRMDMPHDRMRPRFRTFSAARSDRVIPADLVKALKKVAAAERASFFMAMLSAYHVLLYKILGDDGIVTAIPSAAQAVNDQFDLVGHCVNTLPIASQPQAQESFQAFVRRMRQVILSSYDHMGITYGRILQSISVERDPSRIPLTPIIFNIDRQFDSKDLDFAGLRATYHANPRVSEAFEIFNNVIEANGVCTLECQYNTDLYTSDWIDSHLDAFVTLLRAIVKDPQRPLAKLAWAPPAQLERQYFDWNRPAPPPPAATVLTLIDAASEAFGDKQAVVDAERCLSYRQLAQQSNQWAHYLRGAGVERGDFVGVALDRSAAMLPILLGVWKAGGCYVPMDPSYPSDRLKYMLEATGSALVITEQAVATSLPQVAGCRLLLREEIEPAVFLGPQAAAASAAELGAGDLAYVIYTSGSTGLPKGVQVPHGGIVNLLQSMQREPGICANDRLLAVTTLSFDMSVVELYLPLIAGATVVVCSRAATVDGVALANLLRSEQITVMQATPATWRLLIDSDWSGAPLKAITGGEALSRQLADAVLARVTSLWNYYGPTEITVYATGQEIRKDQPIGIGSALDRTSLYVMDRFGLPVPWSVPGELFIGGAGVTRGYRGRDDLTNERFVHLVGVPDLAKTYRTGDLVRRKKDGSLEYIGRNDHQVKVRGYRIELGEIEAVLNRHPQFGNAVVMLREDKADDPRLVGYGETSAAELSEADLLAWAGQFLPAYMLPQHVVLLAKLPLLPNGKIDRQALPPPVLNLEAAVGDQEPKAGLETAIAEVWKATLGLEAVPALASFYALGGHSLLAVRMLSALQRELGIVVTLRTLLENNSVRALALALSGPELAALEPIPALSDGKSARLSIMQERVYYLDQLNPDDITSLLPDGRRFHGPFEPRLFQQVIQTIVDRHPAMRGRVVLGSDGPELSIRDQMRVDLPCIDLSHLSSSEQEDVLAREAGALASDALDVHNDALFRFRLYRLGPDQHVFCTVFHHLIWDGWCFDIFWSEVHALYLGRVRGSDIALEAPKCRYLDFALWHRQASASPAYLDQLPFWQTYLQDLQYLELPTDAPRPARRQTIGARQQFYWDQRQTDLMHALARQEGTTSFVVMLALYSYLLALCSGQRDIIVGTPVQGRGHPDFANVIGYFVNTLVLRTKLDLGKGFRQMVRAVKASAEGALRNQDVAFEDIVKAIGVKPDPSRTTLYSVMFAYQDTSNRATNWAPLQLQQINLPQATVGTDLVLWVRKNEAGLTGGFDYRTDLFSEQRIAAMIAQLTHLLMTLTTQPDIPVAEVPLSSPTELTPSRPRSLLAGICANAASRGDLPFIKEGAHELCGRDFLARAASIRSQLAGLLPPASAVTLAVGSAASAYPALVAGLDLGLSIRLVQAAGTVSRLYTSQDHAEVELLLDQTATTAAIAHNWGQHSAAARIVTASGELMLDDGLDGLMLSTLADVTSLAGPCCVGSDLAGPEQVRWLLFALLRSSWLDVLPAERDDIFSKLRSMQQRPTGALMLTTAQAANLLALDWSFPAHTPVYISGSCPSAGMLSAAAAAKQLHFLVGNAVQASWFAAAANPQPGERLVWTPLGVELRVVGVGGKDLGQYIDGTLSIVGDRRPSTWHGRLEATGPTLLSRGASAHHQHGFNIHLHEQLAQLGQFQEVLYVHPVADAEQLQGFLLLTKYGLSALEGEDFLQHLRLTVPNYLLQTTVKLTDCLPLESGGAVAAGIDLRRACASTRQLNDQPRTVGERRLAVIWQQLLGVDQVRRTDNFFALGGYSLLPLLVINQVQKDTGKRLDIGLFLTQTLASIASQSGYSDEHTELPASAFLVEAEAATPAHQSQAPLLVAAFTQRAALRFSRLFSISTWLRSQS